MNPPLTLVLSIIIILVLIRLKVPVGVSILAGCVFIIIFIIPFNKIPTLLLMTIEDKQTWQLLIIVPCTMAFGNLMEQKGMLTRLATALEGIGARFAIHLLPALIGLVAMPAGALVAATAVKDLSQKLELLPERIAFINYWYRHIWEFSLPLYPVIILTSTILTVPIPTIVKTLLPITGLAIVLGSIVSYRMLKGTPSTMRGPDKSLKSMPLNLLKAAWPILLLIILIFFKVEPWIAFPVTLLLTTLQQKVNKQNIKKAAKYALNPLIILLLLAVMLYQTTAKYSNATGALVFEMNSLGLPSVLILAIIPLLIGLTVGYGPAIAGIVLPLTYSYIITDSGFQPGALLVVFVSGMVGQLLSPAHLCFSLSTAYFKTTLGKVYRYTIPLLIIIEVTVIIIYLFI